MVVLSEIAVILVVLLGALSIPFLANTVSMSAIDDYREGLVPILNETTNASDFSNSDATYYPGSVEKSLGARIFSFQTQTAFGQFFLEIRSDPYLIIKQKLNNPSVTVERIIENNSTLEERWLLVTDRYTLKTSQNFSSVSEEFSNPDGTCKKTKEFGSVSESCSGQLSEIEDAWEDGKKLLKDYAGKINNVTASIELPNIKSSSWDF